MASDTLSSELIVRNLAEPLRFKNIESLTGISANAAKEGEKVKIWTQLSLTSDDSLFHRVVDSFSGVIRHMAEVNGCQVDLRSVDTALLIIKPDSTAELWLDAAAMILQCVVKKSMTTGMIVFEKDIADVTSMCFPCVDFGSKDKVLCIFRQDWRFGLAFDMNPDGDLDIQAFNKTLGSLYRQMRYKHFYDALEHTELFSRLLAAGWFPFAEIINSEFKDILSHCESNFELNNLEKNIVAAFNDARLDNILERWLTKPHFRAKAELMKAAIGAFKENQPIAAIKIILTEIEGVLNDAHRSVYGQGAKIKNLLEFVEISAERKAGGSNTLLFPNAFGKYLKEHTFANFDPSLQTGKASSRHAVGHGAASQDSYTTTRALQAILTLDQLAFYT